MSYKSVTLVPAYGRDYKSKKELLADWNADKDFRMEGFSGSGYFNKQQLGDLKPANITHLHFRYKSLTLVYVMEVK